MDSKHIGLKFGRLTVIDELIIDGNLRYSCLCDCGKKHTATASNIRRGNTGSCGCLRSERTSAANSTHKLSGTPTYKSWKSMNRRCSNPSAHYIRWKGRGISVCDRWKSSFLAFLSDMGERPNSFYSLDRIDNNGDYEPGNCRWATKTDQARNRTNSALVEHDGVTKTIAEWAIDRGIKYGTLYCRLTRYGWPIDKALGFH